MTLAAHPAGRARPGYCPMALDPRGHYLLVPYSIRYPRNPGVSATLLIARVPVPAGRVSILRTSLPGGTEKGLGEIPLAW